MSSGETECYRLLGKGFRSGCAAPPQRHAPWDPRWCHFPTRKAFYPLPGRLCGLKQLRHALVQPVRYQGQDPTGTLQRLQQSRIGERIMDQGVDRDVQRQLREDVNHRARVPVYQPKPVYRLGRLRLPVLAKDAVNKRVRVIPLINPNLATVAHAIPGAPAHVFVLPELHLFKRKQCSGPGLDVELRR